MNSDTDWTVFV